MDEAVSLNAPVRVGAWKRLRARARTAVPTRVETALAVLAAALLVFSFPDFNLWPLAWVGLVPLFLAIARKPSRGRAFLLGWMTGTLFFYGSCYWLTHAMIRYGGVPTWAAYLLIIPPTVIAGLFPATCSMVLARALARWGGRALFVAPLVWIAFEWARLGMIGQLWNAIGYSQAYVPSLIQTARWGGVYAVGFLIVLVNAAIAYLLLQRNERALKIAAAVIVCVVGIAFMSAALSAGNTSTDSKPDAVVVAVQPNVPMDEQSLAEMAALVERHYSLSESGLKEKQEFANLPRVVIWPESPMNFRYAQDTEFREIVARFAARNKTSVIFNAQEPAPAGGTYNSAVLVNGEGRLVAQYDKIRLLPFGEYVPLPRWLPGASSIPAMVGDFTPGVEYTLMPLGGETRAGVFICFESAFPSIARHFTQEGADVLVNISNDGYLGQTPVMRQHLANSIFRAVENARPVVRVTNTGITAFITARGQVLDATVGFQPTVRTWTVSRNLEGQTFYTRFGDLFVGLCAAMSLLIAVLSWRKREPKAVAD